MPRRNDKTGQIERWYGTVRYIHIIPKTRMHAHPNAQHMQLHYLLQFAFPKVSGQAICCLSLAESLWRLYGVDATSNSRQAEQGKQAGWCNG